MCEGNDAILEIKLKPDAKIPNHSDERSHHGSGTHSLPTIRLCFLRPTSSCADEDDIKDDTRDVKAVVKVPNAIRADIEESASAIESNPFHPASSQRSQTHHGYGTHLFTFNHSTSNCVQNFTNTTTTEKDALLSILFQAQSIALSYMSNPYVPSTRPTPPNNTHAPLHEVPIRTCPHCVLYPSFYAIGGLSPRDKLE